MLFVSFARHVVPMDCSVLLVNESCSVGLARARRAGCQFSAANAWASNLNLYLGNLQSVFLLDQHMSAGEALSQYLFLLSGTVKGTVSLYLSS